MTLTSQDDAVDAELVVKLAAQLYRLTEVPLPLQAAPRHSLASDVVEAADAGALRHGEG